MTDAADVKSLLGAAAMVCELAWPVRRDVFMVSSSLFSIGRSRSSSEQLVVLGRWESVWTIVGA